MLNTTLTILSMPFCCSRYLPTLVSTLFKPYAICSVSFLAAGVSLSVGCDYFVALVRAGIRASILIRSSTTTSPFSLKSWAARSNASIKVAGFFFIVRPQNLQRESKPQCEESPCPVLEPRICWLIVSIVFCRVQSEDGGEALLSEDYN
jgi:hypothetical protein